MNNTYIGIVLGVLVVGLFVVFKFTPAMELIPSTRPLPSEDKTFNLVVQNGKLVSGPSTHSFTETGFLGV